MIKILDDNFVPIGEIRTISSMNNVYRWHEMSTCKFKVADSLKYVDLLKEDVRIMLFDDPDLIFMISDMNHEVSSWEFVALSSTCLLNRRIIVPPAGSDTDYYNTWAETIMKSMVSKNVVAPIDTARMIPSIVTASDLQRGPQLIVESRYDNLTEKLTEISRLSGLGFHLPLNRDIGKLQFDVREGRNLVYNVAGDPYVIFDEEFKNVSQHKYNKITSNERNTAFTAGQGEGVNRTIVEVGDYAGEARKEVFIDARDVSATGSLVQRGIDKLNEYGVIENFESNIIQSGRFVYGRDYRLGDIVTLQNRKIEKTLNARIIEVEEIFTGNTRTIKPIFNNKQPDVLQVLKRQMNNVKNSVTR